MINTTNLKFLHFLHFPIPHIPNTQYQSSLFCSTPKFQKHDNIDVSPGVTASVTDDQLDKLKQVRDSVTDVPDPENIPELQTAATFDPNRASTATPEKIIRSEAVTNQGRKKLSDYYLRGMTKNQHYQFAILDNTNTVSKAQEAFDLSPISTAILGETYAATSLLSSFLNGEERVSVTLTSTTGKHQCVAESICVGETRGYITSPKLVLDPKEAPSRLSYDQSFVPLLFPEDSILEVRKVLYGAHEPFTSIVSHQGDSLASSMEHFFQQSEGIETHVQLSTLVDDSGKVLGSGGLMVQTMPGFDEDEWGEFSKLLKESIHPSMGSLIQKNQHSLLSILFKKLFDQEIQIDHEEPFDQRASQLFEHITKNSDDIFAGGIDVNTLRRSPVHFFCRCSGRTMVHSLSTLPMTEIDDILEKSEPIDLTCHMCNKKYIIPLETFEKIKEKKNSL